MSELSEHTDQEIFSEYTRRCKEVAVDIADHLNDNMEHESMHGSKWCEENGVPESVFADAVTYHIVNINYGVSAMYPFREGGEASVLGKEVQK